MYSCRQLPICTCCGSGQICALQHEPMCCCRPGRGSASPACTAGRVGDFKSPAAPAAAALRGAPLLPAWLLQPSEPGLRSFRTCTSGECGGSPGEELYDTGPLVLLALLCGLMCWHLLVPARQLGEEPGVIQLSDDLLVSQASWIDSHDAEPHMPQAATSQPVSAVTAAACMCLTATCKSST